MTIHAGPLDNVGPGTDAAPARGAPGDHSESDTLQTVTEARAGERGGCDVVVIGGGIAGLSVALSLPPSMRLVLISKGALGESNTRYAQGGLAAAVGLDDSPELHLADTLAAGAGLVDEDAARVLVTEARDAVAWLIAAGARFDERHTPAPPDPGDGAVSMPDELATRYALGREAAHSRWRVLHAHGDATGAEIERALVEALRSRPNTVILEHALAESLPLDGGVCAGVRVRRDDGVRVEVSARRGVVLANGGAGRLWLRTSNPAGATADGLALAYAAGATLADLEFAQFHPTVLATAGGEPFLVSEAVRGEGAYLRNAEGTRFMPRYHPDAELAPRDVVARAILSEMLATGAPSVFLDLRHLPAAEMRERFPSITEACRQRGLDLALDLIPVAPAAHYFMGGIATDTWARTTVPHLYAVGEVACTGVHGANRLASNSLLEGLVYGRRAATALLRSDVDDADVAAWPCTPRLAGFRVSSEELILPAATLDAVPKGADEVRERLRRVMWERVSLVRGADGLRDALVELRTLARSGPFDVETANMLFAAQAITAAALARGESRGAHYREDAPERDPMRDGRHSLYSRHSLYKRGVGAAAVASELAAGGASSYA